MNERLLNDNHECGRDVHIKAVNILSLQEQAEDLSETAPNAIKRIYHLQTAIKCDLI